MIGGGNSGVEAAIDLAGIVKHVTLFEFMPMLKADAVLQKKLQTLPNVRVITQAQITRWQATQPARDGRALQRPRHRSHAHWVRRWQAFLCKSALYPAPSGCKIRWSRNAFGEIVIDVKMHHQRARRVCCAKIPFFL